MKKHFLIISIILFSFTFSNAQVRQKEVKDGYHKLLRNYYYEVGRYKNGEKDGSWSKYHKTTFKIMGVSNFLEGKMDGIQILFSTKSGDITKTEYYKEGVKEGPTVEFFDNLKKKSVLNYKDGKLDGVAEKYYENGALLERSIYLNGLKEGKSIWYSKGKKRIAEYYYKNGLFEGTNTSYFENGNKMKIETYTQNILNGPYKEYYRTGKLKEEGNYKDGKKIGEWKYYLPTGKIERTEKH
jgi:antitoxin component YwqK of YwqJK toxin-antitoxin module